MSGGGRSAPVAGTEPKCPMNVSAQEPDKLTKILIANIHRLPREVHAGEFTPMEKTYV